FSSFNTEPEHQERVMETLNSFRLDGRKINVEISQNEGRSSGRRDHNGRGRDRGEKRERFSDSGSSRGSRFSSEKPSRRSSFRAEPSRGSDRKSTRLNSSHVKISYAVFCLKKKKQPNQ